MKFSRIACYPILLLLTGCDPGRMPWPRPSLKFSRATLPDAQAGSDYRAEFSISGNQTPVGGASVVTGALPEGLELIQDRESGGDTFAISGRPRRAGPFTFTVEVACYGTSRDGQVATKDYRIQVH